jgi:hypothetical protein
MKIILKILGQSVAKSVEVLYNKLKENFNAKELL